MDGIICAEQGSKICFFATCNEAGECMGEPCPKDGAYCALKKCVDEATCGHDTYYGQGVAQTNGVAVKSITADPKLAPATTPLPVAKPAPKPRCHIGMRKILMTGGGLELWVGGEKDVESSLQEFDLLISLKGPPKYKEEWQEPVVTADARASRELPAGLFPKPPMAMYVDWPDFGVPRLNAKWWDTLVEYLTSKPMRVAMFCQGGHGRTGTATAILLSLIGVLRDEDDPVAVVREEYCHEAVESHGQLNYVRTITGRTVLETPAGHHMVSWHDDDYWTAAPASATSSATMHHTQHTSHPAGVPTPQMSKSAEKKLKKKLALQAAARAKN